MTHPEAASTAATVDRPVHALVTGLAFGVLSAILLLAGARWFMPATLTGSVGDPGWASRSRAWFIGRGFQSPEVKLETGAAFSWTGPTARFLLPNLDRSQAHRLRVEVTAPRPAGVARTAVRVLVDGREVARPMLTPDAQDLAVDVPERDRNGAIVAFETTAPFSYGGEDTRRLGFIVHEVELSAASGHLSPSWAILLWTTLAVAILVAGLALACPGGPMRMLTAAGTTIALSWLLLQDGAFVGPFIDRVVAIGIGIGALGAIAGFIRRQWPTWPLVPEWPTAVAFALAILAAKLAAFGHPMAIIGDGVFQVHRAQMVAGGSYFFTSVTPKPFFEFPYAIALYVAAMPFWTAFPAEVDKVWLLRTIALVADALLGLALYAIARRYWRDGFLALLAVAIWSFTRAPLIALANANLTNAFGQGMFGLGMVAIAWLGLGVRPGLLTVIFGGALLTVAFLSHFGTVSIGVPVVCVAAATLALGRRPELGRAAVLTVAMLIGASATAFVTYYSHFMPVYRQTMVRVMSNEGESDPGKLVAPPATKLRNWLTERTDDYGIPGLPLAAAAAIGVWYLVRRRAAEGLTRVLGGWALTWLAFSALGILSAIQMRANLSAAPFFAAFGAYGVGMLWRRPPVARAFAVLLGLGILRDGLSLWLGVVGR